MYQEGARWHTGGNQCSAICSASEIHRRRRYVTNWVLPNGSLNDVVLQFTYIKANARWYTWCSATNWVICDGSLLSLSSTQTTAATYRATWWVGPEDTCDHLSPYIFLRPVLENTCKLRIWRKAQTWLIPSIVRLKLRTNAKRCFFLIIYSYSRCLIVAVYWMYPVADLKNGVQ